MYNQLGPWPRVMATHQSQSHTSIAEALVKIVTAVHLLTIHIATTSQLQAAATEDELDLLLSQ